MVVRNSSVEDVLVSVMKVSNALLFDQSVEMIGAYRMELADRSAQWGGDGSLWKCSSDGVVVKYVWLNAL